MVISFINQKGGVGKTTSAINVGAYLSKLNKKVLLIDMDPQANLTSGIGFDETKKDNIYSVLTNKTPITKAFYSTQIKNLYIIPSSIDLAGAEIELVGALSREQILKNKIKDIYNSFDYIIIDSPPSLGLLTINALTATDNVIIPVQCEYFALEGLSQLINTIKLVKNSLNNKLLIGGVLLTMYDSRTRLSKDIVEEVKKVFNKKVFKTIVPRNIRLSESPSFGKPIELYDPKSTGAIAYKNLAEEILNLQ